MQNRNISILAGIFALAAVTASAQTTGGNSSNSKLAGDGKIFASVGFGGQAQTHTFDSTTTSTIYGQNAALATSTGVDGGPFFDVSGGFRFMPKFGVGIGFTSFSETGSRLGTATVPSPVFFNQSATVNLPSTDAERIERSFYVQFVYFYPVTDKIEVDVFGGPSFFHVEQDVVTGFTVPNGTQDVVPSVQRQTATSVGAIVGIDGTYFVTKQIGVGAFMRYNGGSVDLTSAENLKAGGFQIGGAVRFRY
jgi:hypothetical protein